MELSSSSSIPCRSYNSMRLISKRIENENKKEWGRIPCRSYESVRFIS